ncbi:MAG: hypothetical protein H6983_17990 [Ectothiorhodospiraceae bacterium]|nr:hypothetical protein [Ectothiorhodospiraceae bacterium]
MSKTFPRRRMAQVWALQVDVAMDDGSFVDRRLAERTLCKGALARYLGEVRSGAVPHVVDRDLDALSVPLVAGLGAYSLAALTRDAVAQYADDRVARLRRQGRDADAARAAVAQELGLLRAMFETAIGRWKVGLTENPVPRTQISD